MPFITYRNGYQIEIFIKQDSKNWDPWPRIKFETKWFMKWHENDMSSAVLCRESKIAKWHQMTYLCKIEQNVILVWNDTKWQEMTYNDMKWHKMTWNDAKWHEKTNSEKTEKNCRNGKKVQKRKKSAETEKNDVKRRKINDILVNTMTTNQDEFVVKNS